VLGAGDDPASVGIDHRVALVVGEDRHRAGGVVADAGQTEQIVHLAWDDPAEAVANLDCGPMQPQRAARIPKICPLGECFGGRLGGQRGRGGPTVQPGLQMRNYPADWGLLQHELTHQNTPRAEPGTAPRQVARMGGVPRDERWGDHGHAVSLSTDMVRGCPGPQ